MKCGICGEIAITTIYMKPPGYFAARDVPVCKVCLAKYL